MKAVIRCIEEIVINLLSISNDKALNCFVFADDLSFNKKLQKNWVRLREIKVKVYGFRKALV